MSTPGNLAFVLMCCAPFVSPKRPCTLVGGSTLRRLRADTEAEVEVEVGGGAEAGAAAGAAAVLDAVVRVGVEVEV